MIRMERKNAKAIERANKKIRVPGKIRKHTHNVFFVCVWIWFLFSKIDSECDLMVRLRVLVVQRHDDNAQMTIFSYFFSIPSDSLFLSLFLTGFRSTFLCHLHILHISTVSKILLSCTHYVTLCSHSRYEFCWFSLFCVFLWLCGNQIDGVNARKNHNTVDIVANFWWIWMVTAV